MARELTQEELLEYENLIAETEAMRSEGRGKSAEELAGGYGHTLLSSIARGPTLNYPLLEAALSGKSLDELNKEIIAQRDANPKTAFAGELIGGVLTPIPGAGMLKAGGAVGSAVIRGGLKGAATGGLLGAIGNQPDPLHQNVPDRLRAGAAGAVFGGAVGSVIGGVGQKVSNLRTERSAMSAAHKEALELEALLARQAQEASEVGPGVKVDSPDGLPPIGSEPMRRAAGGKQIELPLPLDGNIDVSSFGQVGSGPRGEATSLGSFVKPPMIAPQRKSISTVPLSFDELVLRNAKQKGIQFGEGQMLPRELELVEALAVLGPELENRPLPIHLERVGGTERAKQIKRMTEMPGEVSRAISEADAILKAELHGKARQLVKAMGTQSDDAVAESKDVLSSFYNAYNQTRKALSPHFEVIKPLRAVDNDSAENIIIGINRIANKHTDGSLVEAIPNKETGLIELIVKPFRFIQGIDKHEYNILSQAIKELNEYNVAGLSVGQIQRIREGIRKNIDTSRPRDIKILNEARKLMLDEMDKVANETGGEVRDIMKQWAINEQRNDTVENILGGTIKSRFGATSKNAISPEKVADRILSDSETTRMMKDALGEEGVRRIVGASLSDTLSGRQNATGFSGAYLKRWIDRNKTSLELVMNPDELDRIRAVSTIARLVSDQPPANTSGTATSLMDVAKGAFKDGPIKGTQKALGEYFENEAQKDRFNSMLRELQTKWSPVVNKATKSRLERRAELLKKGKK